MTRPELRSTIEANLNRRGWSVEDLRVQPDPFDGSWKIVVVSADFHGKLPAERKRVALQGIDEARIEWLELLTPDEREWAGNLPLDSDLEQLPLWPEALARGASRESDPPRFPSDLDQDLALPIVATFYSLRGGVGRSTALAYTGQILAGRGHKVVCVDMDLEAPGLAALFGKEQEIEPDTGLIHLLMAYEQGQTPDISKHLLRVREAEDLYCLPAGIPNAEYARLLRFIDPTAWYQEECNPLRLLLKQLREGLPFTPDVVLFDSRTGITALSAPLLFDLADLAVIVFFPHPQARTGTRELVHALLAAHTQRLVDGRPLTPEPRFLISPTPLSKAPEVRQRYENRPLEWISNWLAAMRNGRESLVESDVTHFVPYREVIATSDQVLGDEEVWRDFAPVADWVEGLLPAPTTTAGNQDLKLCKAEILREIHFSAGTAENQEKFLETFVETDWILRALDFAVPLVLGRKGTGKTAIFRRLTEDAERDAIVVTAPAPLHRERSWLLRADGFRGIAEVLDSTGADWRQFWALYTCLACSLGRSSTNVVGPAPEPFRGLLNHDLASQLEVIELVRSLMAASRSALLTDHWLTQIDKAVPKATSLLFDGLDTGFGSTEEDRQRRRAALEGLFSFVNDRGDSLRHLRFKVLLREDIWRHLRFENKSHFYGRSVTLRWNDRAMFLKVALKQAVLAKSFERLLKAGSFSGGPEQVGDWNDREVFSAWNLLVGERMKGGNTAFTRNWVWMRLADGNDDHSPRYLLQLMHQALEWEKQEHPRSPYERSLIRPRGLIEVLPEVSEQALSALRDEEFPELKPLMIRLREIGRTPMDASELTSVPDDLLKLAREVGLLAIHAGSEEEVERYKVPDLFRYGLGMSRRGQQ